MTIDEIKKKTAAEAINGWVREFEREFDLAAKGSYPTQRMKSIIRQLHKEIRKLNKKRTQARPSGCSDWLTRAS